jgi:hypothetical protein
MIFGLVPLFNGACNDKSDIDPTIQYLNIFPNPAVDGVYVDIQNESNNATFSLKVFDPNAINIFDVEGKLNNQKFTIDLSNKPDGTYNVILQKEGSTYIQKFVKL